jgi:hypothetical protein
MNRYAVQYISAWDGMPKVHYRYGCDMESALAAFKRLGLHRKSRYVSITQAAESI